MYTKNLSAIYFSSRSILVCELDASRKHIKKYASVELPEGILTSKKILDKQKAQSYVKELLSKSGIKSREVGIVIPEFSTFTKLASLPKLSTHEISEAVTWQAQEYLPTGADNMVLDWKILEKTDTSTEILMVAVPKEILMDYVNICVDAGLYPIAVETPSISLGNIIDSEAGYMAVYAEKDQTLVVAGEKNKILTTSISTTGEVASLVTNLSRVIKHFSKVEFKNIYVGGEAMNDQIIGALKKEFQAAIKPLSPDISGDALTIQKFLVPSSLLKNPIAEPADPTSVNLLPGNLVGKYQSQKSRTENWSLTLTATVFVWVSLLVVLGAYMVLSQQIAVLKSKVQKNAVISSERTKLQQEATNINAVSTNVLSIKNASVQPEKVLNAIFAAQPAGITLVSYNLDLDKGTVTLKGNSVDRQSLVSFKEALDKDPSLSNVNIPISSFEEVSNLPFSINFNYLPVGPKPTVAVTK